ncbi:hypothetical protein F4823DRAFT_368233 [Ustulina deusta]|nr:hypothetical protein F4823DRAFT_368233 [Ustulina deusta]
MSSKIGLRGLERNTIKNTARTLFEEGYNNPLLRFSFGLYGTIPIGSHINLGNTNEVSPSPRWANLSSVPTTGMTSPRRPWPPRLRRCSSLRARPLFTCPTS